MDVDFINNYKSIIGGIFFLAIVIYSLYGIYRSIVTGGKISYRIQGSITALIALLGFILNFLDIIPFSVSMLLSILLFYIDVAVTKTFALNDLKKELLEGENSIQKKLSNKINELGSQLNVFKGLYNNLINHPLYTTKENFKPVFENLLKLKSTQNQAIKFSVDSLKETIEKGFVKIDVSFKDYTNLLCELTKASQNNIVGTYTVRPEKLKSIESDLTNYVNELKSARIRNVTINRFIVFELKEITEILENHNSKSDVRIEELYQFTQKISASVTKWSSTPLFLKNLNSINIKRVIAPHENEKFMTDFAIFDKELLILWRENHNQYFPLNERTGTLILNWSNDTTALSTKLSNGLSDIFNDFDSLVNYLNSLSQDNRANFHIIEEEFTKFQTALTAYNTKKSSTD